MTLHTISYGGGVQSTALLALAGTERIPHRTFLFANTGDDSEHPDTLAYVRDIAIPWGREHGVDVIEVQRTMRDGSLESILGRIERTAKAEVIPVRSSADGPPLSRSCTVDFKIETLGRWLKDHGARGPIRCLAHAEMEAGNMTAEEALTDAGPGWEANCACEPGSPAHVGVGISLDEIHRANRKPRPYEHITYPLLGAMPGDPDCCKTDFKVRRTDCARIIRDAGLPVPPKSSCWFCPHHSFNAWVELRGERPDLFARAADLETRLTEKAGSPRYLTRYGRPLADAIPDDVETLPFDDSDGSCMDGACGT